MTKYVHFDAKGVDAFYKVSAKDARDKYEVEVFIGTEKAPERIKHFIVMTGFHYFSMVDADSFPAVWYRVSGHGDVLEKIKSVTIWALGKEKRKE
jgi:hypothetical protein